MDSEYSETYTILHELLEQKRQLSQGTLFPTEQVEVTPKEILGSLQSIDVTDAESSPLTIADVDKLEPRIFEAFIKSSATTSQSFRFGM